MREKKRQREGERIKEGRQEVKQSRLEGEELKGDERNQVCPRRTVIFIYSHATCEMSLLMTSQLQVAVQNNQLKTAYTYLGMCLYTEKGFPYLSVK